MKLLMLFIFGFMLLGNTTALADPSIENQKKNAFLVLSAFECAIVSSNEEEAIRLFNLGLNAGRDFIKFANEDIELYRKKLQSKVPLLWNMTIGPTPDFILGQIYANRAEHVYEDFSSDEELWKLKKENMFHDKNCALLGK